MRFVSAHGSDQSVNTQVFKGVGTGMCQDLLVCVRRGNKLRSTAGIHSEMAGITIGR